MAFSFFQRQLPNQSTYVNVKIEIHIKFKKRIFHSFVLFCVAFSHILIQKNDFVESFGIEVLVVEDGFRLLAFSRPSVSRRKEKASKTEKSFWHEQFSLQP